MRRNHKQTRKQIALRFLCVLILLFSFSTIIVGQTEESDEIVPVVVPDQAMEQVVRRILTWYFKPRNKPKIIYLSEQRIQKSWLPEIRNIEFQLLSDAEAKRNEGGVYFFEEPEISGNKYSIGFGFGDIDCDAMGDEWYFRISKQRVRLWHEDIGFGRACSNGNSF